MPTLAEWYKRITPDPWRQSHPFEDNFELCQQAMMAAEKGVVCELLADWLSNYQPCLFGRSAARLGLLS